MTKNLRCLLVGMLLTACGSINPLLAQLVTTNPAQPTDNQEITFIVDLTKATDGRAKGLLGKKDDIYLWSGAGSTDNGDAFQFQPPTQKDFNLPLPVGAMTPLGNDRWQIKLVPRTYYGVPANTPIRRLGIVIKSGDGKAQTEDFYVKLYDVPTVATQALAIASICPGSTFDVPFTISGSFPLSNVFTVQLSNGGDYTDIPAAGPYYNNTPGLYIMKATIPATTAAGTTYKVRVNASNPAVIGTPSNTQFAVKIKPGVPLVQATQSICQAASPAQKLFAIPINVTATAGSGATASLYTEMGYPAGGDYTPNTINGNVATFNINWGTFGYSDTPKFPVAETNFYAAQTVNGCQSDLVKTTVRTLYWPGRGPKPANEVEASRDYGSLTYCQGEKALPLNVNGHGAPIENYRVVYKGPHPYYTASSDFVFTNEVPTPPTSATGETYYTFKYDVIDPTKSCNPIFTSYYGHLPGESYLKVTINAKPIKPITSGTLTYCQNQTANLLTAIAADANASLVWYGTDATGGTGSPIAPRPATTTAGTFKYYVAQRLNNCEGDRAEISVEVKAASPVPTVSSVSYCVGAQASQLSAVAASGGSLSWYTSATGGTASGAGPTPLTSSVGAQTYYVAQTVGANCESQRVGLLVTVTGLPSAPTISNANPTFCQNAAAAPLSATGQNLMWYNVATGGTGASTITPNTSVAGSNNFYVSQTVSNCEGPRASLLVMVKPTPAAPVGTSPTSYCQFAKGEAVAASGQNLVWYNADDSQFGTGSQAPVLTTDVGRTFTYKVTQTVDGCASPKATINVVIQTTPVPTVAKAIVELCQGGIADALKADGTNLRWTDPTGAVSTSAPVPTTLNATKNPDGDAFYVTQTGSNGCESPRATIKVFVQTVPTMSLSGANTVNLGIEAPIKLSFTGVGPYSYTLSNGLVGNATKDTTVLVLPTRNTTYQIAQVKNKCGTGLPGNGAALTITVMVPGIQTLTLTSSTICVGTQLTASFQTTGTFNTGSIFKLQLAKVETDTTKILYTDVVNGSVSGGQITGTIPMTAVGGQYFVRVMATNPRIPIFGTNSPTLLTIRSTATATLTGTQSIYETQTAKLSIAFTGEAPWTVTYQDSSYATGAKSPVQTIQTAANPYTFDVKPDKTTAYLLTSVSNICGVGTRIATSAVITVGQLLAVKEPFSVEVFPVPATTSVTIRMKGLTAQKPAFLTLTDENGRLLQQQQMGQDTWEMPLGQQPAGTYILRINVGDQVVSKRILKL